MKPDLGTCIISPFAINKSNGGGYPTVQIKGRTLKHHRLVYALTAGVPIADLKGKVVLHLCDNRRCVNPDHLALGSQLDNMQDMLSKNRQASKLSPEDVVEIKRLLATTRMLKQSIALQFDISPAQVSRIASGKNWKQI